MIQDPKALAASLPFRIIESLKVPCGYERSFKLTFQRLLANRYILGIQTSDVTKAQILEACTQLKMPESLQDEFIQSLNEANMVFLGFEDGEDAGCTYKVYLEYWDRLLRNFNPEQKQQDPHLLHKGFKWLIDTPEKSVITLYQAWPGLGMEEILDRIRTLYRQEPEARTLSVVLEIIERARIHRGDGPFLFMDVLELGNPRKSYDLNLYPSGMVLGHISKAVLGAVRAFNGPEDRLERLMTLVRGKFFGHLSAGFSRSGEEYLTFYYEN